MRSLFLILLFSILILTACNLPFTTTAEPTVDVIGTQVAVSLTRQPSPTSQQGLSATPTKSTAASTNLPSTLTVSPTSAQRSATPTGLPSVTATTKPSATATSSDPRLSLGTPVWKDIFTNGKGWGLEDPYDDGNTRVEIKNNNLIMTSFAAKGWLGWRVSYPKAKDFYLEATLQVDTCAVNDQYGLIFRSPDQNSGYWFGVTCDGRFYLRSGEVNSFTEIIKLTTTSDLKIGSNQTNRLGGWVKGNKITLFVNGKSIQVVTDSAFPDSGMFGYFIAGLKTPNFIVKSSEIAYWNVP